MARKKIKVRKPLNKEKIVAIVGPILVLLIAVLFFCWKSGYFSFGTTIPKGYQVQGTIVSSEQGYIDWQDLASSNKNLAFAYMKATEGSSYEDDRFDNNWTNSKATALRTGAYHYFSFDSSGETQASNFINNVPVEQGRLGPAIMIEFYNGKDKNPPNEEEVVANLTQLKTSLEEQYGQQVIFYVSEKIYHLYIEDYFPNQPIWLYGQTSQPDLKWTYWEYDTEEKLKGGAKKEFPVSVFNGDSKQFSGFEP
ncbi:GH25 family lysozyme [Isobaculum melis]|uniref:Lysozyme n=1 Tax=Isobaculum melis TaxID=142588 RepID=A0A1H9SVI8_9LACT|nr:GH25 family lysozyme [Isobaculum melis]SER88389.1 lysozyme [Isobaculum melis]